jgi:glycosyltransferase involved in cell wall biosynthesis
MYRLFRRLRPSIVHTHQSKAGILGRIAAAASRTPLVVHTIHIAPFVSAPPAQRAVYIVAEKMCGRFTDLFIAVSGAMRDAYKNAGIGRADQYDVVRSGMALDRFRTCSAPANWSDRIGGWPSEHRPKIVLMLAAFEPRKRQRQFLRAAARHLKNRPATCIVFAGTGTELEACKREAADLGISDQVRFLGHDDRPEELIALADVCILTSEREGLPRVIVQYIAAGKPTVICDLPGLEELIEDGANGLIADPEDLGAMAERLFNLLNDDGELGRLSAGARMTDVSEWQDSKMGERIQASYDRTLRREAASAG